MEGGEGKKNVPLLISSASPSHRSHHPAGQGYNSLCLQPFKRILQKSAIFFRLLSPRILTACRITSSVLRFLGDFRAFFSRRIKPARKAIIFSLARTFPETTCQPGCAAPFLPHIWVGKAALPARPPLPTRSFLRETKTQSIVPQGHTPLSFTILIKCIDCALPDRTNSSC